MNSKLLTGNIHLHDLILWYIDKGKNTKLGVYLIELKNGDYNKMLRVVEIYVIIIIYWVRFRV